MKRLFEIRGVKNAAKSAYFENKQDAKAARRNFNGLDKEGNENFDTGYRVTCGPDHWLFNGGQK